MKLPLIMGINEALRAFGLNEKETKVYLALLEMGISKVNEIAEKADIMRETTYGILKSLAEKGLVSYVIKSGVKYYSGADPEKLIQILKDKQKKINEVLPQLNEFKKYTYHKPKVEFYEGAEGLRTVYREIIREPHKEIYSFLNMKFFSTILPFFAHQISEERKQKKIKSLLLMDDSPQAKEVQARDKKEYRETKVLPLVNDMKTGIYIFGKSIAFFSFSQKEPVAIVIENEDVAKALESIFKHFWAEQKK